MAKSAAPDDGTVGDPACAQRLQDHAGEDSRRNARSIVQLMLLAGYDPASGMRPDGLLGELKQALLNRLMAAEFDHRMDQDRASGEGGNHRNDAPRKRVLTGDDAVQVRGAWP